MRILTWKLDLFALYNLALSSIFLTYRLYAVQISFPDWLTPQFAYIAFSAIIAVLIWTEGEMLKRSKGKLPKSLLFQLSSLLSTAWFFISIALLYLIDFTPLAVAIPAAYGIYTVFGLIYGTRLLRRRGIPDSPEDLVVPPKYIAYSQSFALIFFALCLFVAASPWLPLTIWSISKLITLAGMILNLPY